MMYFGQGHGVFRIGVPDRSEQLEQMNRMLVHWWIMDQITSWDEGVKFRNSKIDSRE